MCGISNVCNSSYFLCASNIDYFFKSIFDVNIIFDEHELKDLKVIYIMSFVMDEIHCSIYLSLDMHFTVITLFFFKQTYLLNDSQIYISENYKMMHFAFPKQTCFTLV
jgi:hypothetical protein